MTFIKNQATALDKDRQALVKKYGEALVKRLELVLYQGQYGVRAKRSNRFRADLEFKESLDKIEAHLDKARANGQPEVLKDTHKGSISGLAKQFLSLYNVEIECPTKRVALEKRLDYRDPYDRSKSVIGKDLVDRFEALLDRGKYGSTSSRSKRFKSGDSMH